MPFITKNATIKLVKKNTINSMRDSGRNHAVRLIRQVQQLSHTREQKLSLEQRDLTENLCASGEFHSGSSTNNQHVQKLTELVIWMYMQTYVLAMFVQMKYFIIKITFHNFITDTEHRKLKRMMVKTSVKRFFSKYMRGDKFQTTYINQINSSLL